MIISLGLVTKSIKQPDKLSSNTGSATYFSCGFTVWLSCQVLRATQNPTATASQDHGQASTAWPLPLNLFWLSRKCKKMIDCIALGSTWPSYLFQWFHQGGYDGSNQVKIPIGSFYCPKNVTGSRGAVDPGMPANAIGFLERNRSGVARGTCLDLME